MSPDRIASIAYSTVWIGVFGFCITVAWRARSTLSLLDREYASFLKTPWRLASATLGTLCFVALSRYASDPYWDAVVGIFMPVVTYLTAPWVVGILYRATRRKDRDWLPLALCLWLFSTSWSYDLYNFIKMGSYPRTWTDNLIASNVLYASGGLLWNFTVDSSGRATLSFLHEPWPQAPRHGEVRGVWLWVMVTALVIGSIVIVTSLSGSAPTLGPH